MEVLELCSLYSEPSCLLKIVCFVSPLKGRMQWVSSSWVGLNTSVMCKKAGSCIGSLQEMAKHINSLRLASWTGPHSLSLREYESPRVSPGSQLIANYFIFHMDKQGSRILTQISVTAPQNLRGIGPDEFSFG